MKCSLLTSLLLVSSASCGLLSHSKRCRERPVEKCSWVEVPSLLNVTENVCKKVEREKCVTKMKPEVTAEQTRVCQDVAVVSCDDVVTRRCETPERTENRSVTVRECRPTQQTVSSDH